ncbi:MAG: ATP-dependent DNA helicase, partial [Henriciella sp.]
SLKLNRGSKRPFGGIRMILAGDLHQLPPVIRGDEIEIMQERYGGGYFFNAPAFHEAEFSLLALKHVFRQSDPRFISLLGSLRQGRLTSFEQELLNSLVSERSAVEASQTHIVLTPNNANAYRINQARLDELPGAEKIFSAKVQGTFEEKSFPTDGDLALKIGARVMLIKNDPEGRWVNGSLASVVDYNSGNVIVELNGRHYEIEPAAWEKYRYSLDTKTNKIGREIVGTFKQVPLRLAYAVTIHKAQGLTLDKVFIDFDSGMFAHGQAYVAFSRASSLDGLEISRPLRSRDLVIDRSAFDFGPLDTIEENESYLLAQFAKTDDTLV